MATSSDIMKIFHTGQNLMENSATALLRKILEENKKRHNIEQKEVDRLLLREIMFTDHGAYYRLQFDWVTVKGLFDGWI